MAENGFYVIYALNNVMAHEDWMPTLLAAAGDPNVKEEPLKGAKVGDKTFKTHLDGYKFMPFFKGETAEGPRREFFYFSDNADLMAVRYNDCKISFKSIQGNLFTGKEDSTNVPLLTNLRQDPWERFQSEGMMYGRWWGDHLCTLVPSMAIVGQFLGTFKEYPPSQVSGSNSVTRFLEAIERGGARGGN